MKKTEDMNYEGKNANHKQRDGQGSQRNPHSPIFYPCDLDP